MKLTPWLVLLCLGLVGCSGSKSAKKVDESSPQIELSDADEFIENPNEEVISATEEPASNEDPIVTDVTDSELPAESEAVVVNNDPVANNSQAGAVKQYTVGKNETLMLIAFKIYGDYEKWKNLANENQAVLKGHGNLREGMVLNYTAPAEEFVWNPSGNPYLIRTGDTLGAISKSVYHTISKWKLLWENNRTLIKDPNKIYAGFTIYYVDGREVASEL